MNRTTAFKRFSDTSPGARAARRAGGLIRSRASWTRLHQAVGVSDGSPRPTCASTATRWPRTPTTGDTDHATAANMTCWTRPLSPSDSQAGLFSPHERTLWSRSGRMTVPFDWIEDPRTTQRPRPSEPNWRKVALVLAAIAILVALAIAFGEIIR